MRIIRTKDVLSSLIVALIFFRTIHCNCPLNKGVEINSKGATVIYTGLYDTIHGSVSNMDLVARATKHVENLRSDPAIINPDSSIENSTINTIQNLMFDLFLTTGSEKSIFMGYSNKRFVSYRVRPQKTFDYFNTTSGVLNSYKYDSTSGLAILNKPESSETTFDVSSRPWFTEASQSSKCPYDKNSKVSCSLGWTSVYKDYKVNQLVVTAFHGIPDYSGALVLPDTTGVLAQGRALHNSLLGVVASDIFLADLDDILIRTMSSHASSSADLAYVITLEGELLTTSDGSLTYTCNLADCSDITSIKAKESSNDLVASSAAYILENDMKSDNSMIWQDSSSTDAQDYFALTVKKFQPLGLDWIIVLLSKIEYHTSCSVVVQSVTLSEAVHSVDVLTTYAANAGDIVRNGFLSRGGVIPSVKPMKFEDINNNAVMSAQNILKVVCETFPDILSVFIGYQDSSFIQYKNSDGRVLSSFTFQDSSEDMKSMYYSNPLSGYVYTELGPHQVGTYTVTERPWYLEAKQQGTSLFSAPYVFSDRNTIGVTYSAPFYNNLGDLAGVVGVDISLSNLAEQLQRFASPAVSIFATETALSRFGADFNMLASSSQAQVAFKDSGGRFRLSKAYIRSEVQDYYIYETADYMKAHDITIDSSFTSNNLSCSVINYKKHGIIWRLVMATYSAESEKNIYSGESGGASTSTNTYSVSPTMLGITIATFLILVIFSILLGWIIYRQHRTLLLVSKRVKKVTRRQKANDSMIMQNNPMWRTKAIEGMEE